MKADGGVVITGSGVIRLMNLRALARFALFEFLLDKSANRILGQGLGQVVDRAVNVRIRQNDSILSLSYLSVYFPQEDLLSIG